MPNLQNRRVILVVVGLAFAGIIFGIVSNHKAVSTPIVIQPPAGAAALPTPMPAPPVPQAKRSSDTPKAAVPAAVMAAATPPAPKPSEQIYVHVAGAVKHPSLYQLAPDSRVWHAIKAAGGANANADEDAVNLAAKLHDGEKVFLPTKAAAAKPAAIAQTAVYVAPVASVPIAVKGSHATPLVGAKGGARVAGAGKPTKLVSASQGQININTATAEQLEELPGIGPAMASRVIGYRQQAGSFQKPEDLMSVGGIGPKKFARIAPLIKLH